MLLQNLKYFKWLVFKTAEIFFLKNGVSSQRGVKH